MSFLHVRSVPVHGISGTNRLNSAHEWEPNSGVAVVGRYVSFPLFLAAVSIFPPQSENASTILPKLLTAQETDRCTTILVRQATSVLKLKSLVLRMLREATNSTACNGTA